MSRRGLNALEPLSTLVGLVVGALVAWAVVNILPVSIEPIEAAKSLGIVSVTTLLNYPKHMEAVYYAVFLVLMPAFAVFFWLFHNRVFIGAFLPNKEARHFDEDRPFPLIGYILVSLFAVYLTYYGAYFTTNWINGWYLFSEEGEMISWAASILSGEVLYRDNFTPYGPLMSYSLAFMMKIFGATVFTSRLYAYLTYAATAVLIVVVSFATLRQRWQAAIAAFFMLVSFFPVKNSVNATPLRQFLGILALFILYRHLKTGSRRTLLASGFVAGIAFLYSQENGLAAIVAALLFWALKGASNKAALRKTLVDASCFAAAFIAVVLPFAAYFYMNDALSAFLSTIYEYPKLAVMGLAALPAPNVIEQIRLFLEGRAATPYFLYSILFCLPPLVYAASFGLLAISRINGKGRFIERDAFFFLMTVYGAIIFRSALGRSDGFHFVQVFAPAVFVLAYISGFSFSGASQGGRRALKFVIIFVIPMAFAAGNFLTTFYEETAENIFRINTTAIFEKFSPTPRSGLVTTPFPELEGVYMPPEVAFHISELKNFASRASLDEQVYVLGNASLAYVLIDKTSPARFDMYYWAATTELQQEVIEDLERARPKYVIIEPGGMLDNIPRETHVPLINDYVFTRYRRADGFYFATFAVYERI